MTADYLSKREVSLFFVDDHTAAGRVQAQQILEGLVVYLQVGDPHSPVQRLAAVQPREQLQAHTPNVHRQKCWQCFAPLHKPTTGQPDSLMTGIRRFLQSRTCGRRGAIPGHWTVRRYDAGGRRCFLQEVSSLTCCSALVMIPCPKPPRLPGLASPTTQHSIKDQWRVWILCSCRSLRWPPVMPFEARLAWCLAL